MISNIFVEPITENIRGNHTVLAEVDSVSSSNKVVLSGYGRILEHGE